MARDQGSISCWDNNILTHRGIGGQCELQTKNVFKNVRTRFLVGGVTVMVSRWSSSYDACPDSERPGLDPP